MFNSTRQFILAGLAIAATTSAVAQLPVDDLRVRQLESEVQRLQRQVDDQSRRIQMLEQAARLNPSINPSIEPPAAGMHEPDSSPAWLVTTNWDRLKIGMKALDVIAVLGRPTSTRHDDKGNLNVLFYAMELGPDKFLTGTIRMDDSGVVEINRPVLK